MKAKDQSQDLAFNKANFHKIKQEKEMLKITLKHITCENEKLKDELEDMKITAKQNKELLREYVNQITNKDKVFEKMNANIEQLTNRLKVLENHNKIKNNAGSANDLLGKKTHNNKGRDDSNKTFPNQNLTLSTSNITTSNPNPISNPNSNSNPNLKEDKHQHFITSNKKNDEKIKDFIKRQLALVEEMAIVKDDIQFIKENKTKTKLKDKLNQSMTSNSNQSLSNSVIHSSYISNKQGSNMNDSSLLNSSIISDISTQTVKKKINLKDRFFIEGNLTEFLSNYNQLKNILFLIDNRGIVWEIIKRSDVTPNMITTSPNNMKSIIFGDNTFHDKLHNIEIKDPFDNHSLAASEEEFGKYSEFSISKYI